MCIGSAEKRHVGVDRAVSIKSVKFNIFGQDPVREDFCRGLLSQYTVLQYIRAIGESLRGFVLFSPKSSLWRQNLETGIIATQRGEKNYARRTKVGLAHLRPMAADSWVDSGL